MQQIHIIIIEERSILREALLFVLNREPCFTVSGEAAKLEDAPAILNSRHADVALVDASSPGISLLNALNALKRRHPETRIIALTDKSEGAPFYSTLRAVVDSCLLRQSVAGELVRTIRSVASSPPYVPAMEDQWTAIPPPAPAKPIDLLGLSPRELQVLEMMAVGASSKDIARDLGIARKTVDNHRASIMAKLGVHNGIHAVNSAVELGLIHK